MKRMDEADVVPCYIGIWVMGRWVGFIAQVSTFEND